MARLLDLPKHRMDLEIVATTCAQAQLERVTLSLV